MQWLRCPAFSVKLQIVAVSSYLSGWEFFLSNILPNGLEWKIVSVLYLSKSLISHSRVAISKKDLKAIISDGQINSKTEIEFEKNPTFSHLETTFENYVSHLDLWKSVSRKLGGFTTCYSLFCNRLCIKVVTGMLISTTSYCCLVSFL